MKLLASLVAISRADFSVPFDVMPANYPDDCLGENGSACIDCIPCTYFNYNGQDQGGVNCRTGPFGGIDVMPYYKEWCRSNIAGVLSDYDGVNDDFHNIECAATHTKVRTFCTVRVEATSTNNNVEYKVTRSVRGVRAELYDNGELGLPQMGGRYELRAIRRASVHCIGDNCNDLDVSSFGEPSVRNDGDFNCKSCRYSQVGDVVEGEECFNSPAAVQSETCSSEGSGETSQGCMLRATRTCSNYQGGNEFCSETSETLVRGCSDYPDDLSQTETEIYQLREQGCAEYDSCNTFSIDIDPDDIGLLPRAGNWDRPLTDIEQEMYCGFGGETCVACEICSGYFCATSHGQQNNDNQVAVYRRRYYDESRSDWMYNVCQTWVIEGTAISEGQQIDLEQVDDTVYRLGVQMSDAEFKSELDSVSIKAQPVVTEYCGTDECTEGSSDFTFGTEVECLRCVGDDCDQVSPNTEMCSTGVCQIVTKDGSIFRSCLKDANLAKKVADLKLSRIEDVGKTYSCDGNRCNTQHVQGNEFKLEEEYFSEKAIPVTNEAACYDPNGAEGNTDLCQECIACEYFVDSLGNEILPELADCANNAKDASTALYFKDTPGFTGPIENYCGLHVERQVSTAGWKYRIIRGGLEGINPNHVGASSAKVQQTRSSLFVCEEDNCNSWGIEHWPMPPIIMPRKTRQQGDTLNCITCDESDTDCFNNAEKFKSVQCEEGEYCAAYYQEFYSKNDIGFWQPKDTITRQCYPLSDDVVSYEYVTRDIETYACIGEKCNDLTLPDTHLPPLGQLPKDQDRWEEPLSPGEVSLYCGNGVECIECFSCEHAFVDAQPSEYECQKQTFRKTFIKDSADNLVENMCATVVGYSSNNLCETTRFVSKGVSQAPVGEGLADEVIEESEMTFVKEAQCLQCTSQANCDTTDVTCPSNNNLCFIRRLLDGAVVEAGCADGLMQLLYDRGVDKISYNSMTTTCETDSCNEVGIESTHLPNYECDSNDPSDDSSFTVTITLSLIFLTTFV